MLTWCDKKNFRSVGKRYKFLFWQKKTYKIFLFSIEMLGDFSGTFLNALIVFLSDVLMDTSKLTFGLSFDWIIIIKFDTPRVGLRLKCNNKIFLRYLRRGRGGGRGGNIIGWRNSIMDIALSWNNGYYDEVQISWIWFTFSPLSCVTSYMNLSQTLCAPSYSIFS